jgi:hypothetical protein
LAGALALFVCVTGFRNSSAMFDQLQINYVDINVSIQSSSRQNHREHFPSIL